MMISIHALVKRATVMLTELDYKIYISIHALVKRATFESKGKLNSCYDFNPRPREEGDFLSPLRYGRGSSFQSTPS